MKRIFLFLSVASILFLFNGCSSTKTGVPQTKEKADNNVTVDDVRKQLAENVLTVKPADYDDETSEYIIEIKYPEIKYSDPKFETFGKAINAKISAHIKDKIDYFISEVKNWGSTPEDIAMTTKSSLYTTYQMAFLSPQLISIRFNNSIYHAGAAHPETYTSVLNYDIENDHEIMIGDVFEKNAGWEKVLSDYAVPVLNDKLKTDFEFDDKEWLAEGAGPKADNFTVYTFGDDGMNFTWDPYIVAPYAAGPQSVTVPYSEIEDFLNFNIKEYLKR